MMEWACQEGDGFLLVYSVASRRSLEELHTFVEEIGKWREKPEKAALVVVGNKCDLGPDEREVSVASTSFVAFGRYCLRSDCGPLVEGELVARQLGAGYLEVSAKDGTNVREAYLELARRVLANREHYFAARSNRVRSTSKTTPASDPRIPRSFKAYCISKCLIA